VDAAEAVMLAAGEDTSARSTRGAPEGERKQVTVLFADIGGSMSLAEAIGAEDLQWIDGNSLAFHSGLISDLQHTREMVRLSYRHGY
jgi:class 3 adenylate cyclase